MPMGWYVDQLQIVINLVPAQGRAAGCLLTCAGCCRS